MLKALLFSYFGSEDIGLFRCKLKHRLFLYIKLSEGHWDHTVGSPGSPACQLSIDLGMS